jgi:hypothetical protein
MATARISSTCIASRPTDDCDSMCIKGHSHRLFHHCDRGLSLDTDSLFRRPNYSISRTKGPNHSRLAFRNYSLSHSSASSHTESFGPNIIVSLELAFTSVAYRPGRPCASCPPSSPVDRDVLETKCLLREYVGAGGTTTGRPCIITRIHRRSPPPPPPFSLGRALIPAPRSGCGWGRGMDVVHRGRDRRCEIRGNDAASGIILHTSCCVVSLAAVERGGGGVDARAQARPSSGQSLNLYHAHLRGGRRRRRGGGEGGMGGRRQRAANDGWRTACS